MLLRRGRDAAERGKRLPRIVGRERSKWAGSALMSSTSDSANLNGGAVSRATIAAAAGSTRSSDPQRFARHRGAEQIARDALRSGDRDRRTDRIGLDIGRIAKNEVVHLPDHALGAPAIAAAEHEALLARIRPGHRQLERVDAERAVDVALAEMDRERGAHEDGVEILATDQPGILHARVVGIHGGESREGRNSCRGSTTKLSTAGQSTQALLASRNRHQMCDGAPHQNLK